MKFMKPKPVEIDRTHPSDLGIEGEVLKPDVKQVSKDISALFQLTHKKVDLARPVQGEDIPQSESSSLYDGGEASVKEDYNQK